MPSARALISKQRLRKVDGGLVGGVILCLKEENNVDAREQLQRRAQLLRAAGRRAARAQRRVKDLCVRVVHRVVDHESVRLHVRPAAAKEGAED
jgi:hypothetical protein